TVSGGTPGYSYAWSNGSSAEDQNNLAAGSYTVTVTDSKGCTKIETYQITTSPGIKIEENINHVKCFGGNDGSITISITTGTSPYSITWSNGTLNTTTISNLVAGSYSVTVTDANGCSQVKTYIVNQPPVLVVDGAINHVTCYGQNSGAISLNVSGGTPGYSYSWSNGATQKDISALVSGAYTVTVTDTKGCSAVKSFIVNQATELIVNGTSKNPTCFNGADGAINLTVAGGTPGYAYTWSNGAFTQNLSGISAGNYSVTVTDANGCKKTASFTLVNPSEIQITGIITNAACSKSTGSINITVSGGTPGYNYKWSNGSTSEDLSNLLAGNYTVTVTDSKGCNKIATFTVNDKGGINLFGTVVDVSCFGGNDGSASISISNATLPVAIHWSNGASNVTNISNLVAGNYSVTVTDAIACVEVKNFIIQQPPVISVSGNVSNVMCNGQNTGSVSLTVSGGTPGYTFQWSNGASTQNISGLAAGNYSVTVTDSKGCKSIHSYTVAQPLVLSVSGIIVNPTCYNGANGSISITVSGGTPNFAYNWSNGSTTKDISGLSAGNYSITVTDANGCSKTTSFTISNPTEIQVTGQINHATCSQANGNITITVSGGAPGYTYAWSNGANTKDISNLAAGTYNVTVTDVNGCTKIKTFTVDNLAGPSINGTVVNVSCDGGNNGSVSITVSGGTNPYSTVWSNGSVNTFTISNLTAGTYSVTVTDSKQCTAVQSFTVAQPAVLGVSITKTNISCNNGSNGSLTANVSGGTPVYSYKWSNGQTTQQIQNLIPGTYTVTVTDAHNCTSTASATLTNPPALVVSFMAGKTSCYNSADASIILTVSGGTSPYSYLWENGSTSKDRFNLAKGNYSVTITDFAGCTKIENIPIFSPIQMTFDLQVTHQTCLDKNDGKISVTNLLGGVPNYTYKWNNPGGSTTPTISNLAPGTYTVTITDVKGCTEVKSATVNPSNLKCTVNIGDYVWLDEDKDGIQDANEMGVNGIVVHLINLGPDGILGTGDDIIVDTEYTKTKGGTKGYYYFPDVPAGTYVIMFFADKDKYNYSPQYQGSDPAKDSNVYPSTGKTDIFTVNVGDQDDLRFDAGIYVYCDNVTSGGVICCNETICKIGGTPSLIESVLPASGGSGGPIEYVWNKSTKNPYYYPNSPDWEMIPNSNTPSYQPGPITETTYYIRCSRRAGCGPFVGEANIVTKKVVDAKQADILDAPPIICYNMPITLNSIDYGAGVTYEWHLGYGAVPATATTPSVLVNWPTPGLKNIQLKVTTDGCVSTDIAIVSVESCKDMVVNNFTAILNSELSVDLKWRLDNTGSNLFEILRSQDNVNFVAINSLKGFPDKDGYYRILDKKPEIGMNYYQIKAYAANGLYTISETRSVLVNDTDNRNVVVYPNPASDYITIEPLESDLGATEIQLTDVAGRVLKSYKLSAGFKQFDVDVSSLASGVYFINVKTEGKRPFTYKVIKQE
ncbi:MAG: T9SS type A sorting domain-containing protein, partial [Saprospiraceae bacterium]|nr:T9SS type A sorting domain-containing protein [Saprospiraceae bacterium]